MDIPEPRLPANLEGVETPSDAAVRDWHATALRVLASQLGYGNDYYYPLLGAAQLLDGKTSRQAISKSQINEGVE